MDWQENENTSGVRIMFYVLIRYWCYTGVCNCQNSMNGAIRVCDFTLCVNFTSTRKRRGFHGGSVVESTPMQETQFDPGLGRSTHHGTAKAHVPQLLSPCTATTEACIHLEPVPHNKRIEKPVHTLQPEE